MVRMSIDEVPAKEYAVELYGQHFRDFDNAQQILDVWQVSFVVRDSSGRILSKADLQKLAASGK